MTERIEDPLGHPKKGSRSTTVRFALIIAAALILGVVAGLAGVYGIMGDGRNAIATGPASVVPGAATFAMVSVFGDVLRHAAALA